MGDAAARAGEMNVRLAYLRPSETAAAELVVVDADGLRCIRPLNRTQLAVLIEQASGLLRVSLPKESQL